MNIPVSTIVTATRGLPAPVWLADWQVGWLQLAFGMAILITGGWFWSSFVARACRKRNEHYRLIFERSPAPMWIYDAASHAFLAVNEAAIRLYRYSRTEFLAMRFEEIAETPLAPLHRRRDGAPLEVELVREPLLFGGRSARLAVITDVTARRKSDAKLRELHDTLVESSRHAGMAEVATDVLHNVGNVLNSVNVSASLVSERALGLRSEGLARAASRLEEHTADLADFLSRDAQGRQLTDFFKRLAHHFTTQREAIIAETAALNRSVEHIREIIAVQQSAAANPGLAEPCALADLIESAIRLNAPAIKRADVRLKRKFTTTPKIVTDRHKVLQILVNLLRNATQACEARAGRGREVRIGTALHGDRVRIDIADNGIGIAAENLVRIFAHGFTTKRDGHGFGLHSGALCARELGGSLQASSRGRGFGATFTLELPLQPPEAPGSHA